METEPAKAARSRTVAVLKRSIPRWLLPAVAAGVLVLGLVVAWGVILRVKTANGMIELVNLPKDAEVLVDGDGGCRHLAGRRQARGDHGHRRQAQGHGKKDGTRDIRRRGDRAGGR